MLSNNPTRIIFKGCPDDQRGCAGVSMNDKGEAVCITHLTILPQPPKEDDE